jgi:hypothetical protein
MELVSFYDLIVPFFTMFFKATNVLVLGKSEMREEGAIREEGAASSTPTGYSSPTPPELGEGGQTLTAISRLLHTLRVL